MEKQPAPAADKVFQCLYHLLATVALIKFTQAILFRAPWYFTHGNAILLSATHTSFSQHFFFQKAAKKEKKDKNEIRLRKEFVNTTPKGEKKGLWPNIF